MKKQTIILAYAIIWFVASTCLAATINVCNASQKQERLIQIIQRPTEQPGNAPRGQFDNPFSAVLLQTGLLLQSDSDWGEADVTLESVEGNYFFTVFDTGAGDIFIPIYGNTGDSYIVTIITSDGLVFEGSFVL